MTTAHLYDAMRHALMELVVSPESVTELREQVRAILPAAEGAIALMVGDHRFTATAYANPESLVWRDAGCLLATLHICAEWLGLALCPVGILGQSFVDSVDAGGTAIAAGGCVVGEEVPESSDQQSGEVGSLP